MNKIKVFFTWVWIVTQGVGVTTNTARASSENFDSCAGNDALIIGLVSTGVVILEKIIEKIYRFCMARRHNMEQASEAEQTDGLENINDTTAVTENKDPENGKDLL